MTGYRAFGVLFIKDGYVQESFGVNTETMIANDEGVFVLPFNAVLLEPDRGATAAAGNETVDPAGSQQEWGNSNATQSK